MDNQWEKENVIKHEEKAAQYEQEILSFVRSCDFYKDDAESVENITKLAEQIRLGNFLEGTGLFEEYFSLISLLSIVTKKKRDSLPLDFEVTDSNISAIVQGKTGIKILDEIVELSNLPVYEFIKESKLAAFHPHHEKAEFPVP